jgi:hypothetical protein
VPGRAPTTFWVDGEFNDAGAAKMQRATEGHIDKPVNGEFQNS